MSRITVRDDIFALLVRCADGLSAGTIASYIGSPVPSVRRCILELRVAGHNIIREGKRYRLVQPEAAGV